MLELSQFGDDIFLLSAQVRKELRFLMSTSENFALLRKTVFTRLKRFLSLVPSLTSFLLGLRSHKAKQGVQCLVATQYLSNRNGVLKRQILLSTTRKLLCDPVGYFWFLQFTCRITAITPCEEEYVCWSLGFTRIFCWLRRGRKKCLLKIRNSNEDRSLLARLKTCRQRGLPQLR